MNPAADHQAHDTTQIPIPANAAATLIPAPAVIHAPLLPTNPCTTYKADNPFHKTPALPFILSLLLFPGLGHIALSQQQKGKLFVIVCCVIAIPCVACWCVFWTWWLGAILLAVYIACDIFISVDALFTAKTLKGQGDIYPGECSNAVIAKVVELALETKIRVFVTGSNEDPRFATV